MERYDDVIERIREIPEERALSAAFQAYCVCIRTDACG